MTNSPQHNTAAKDQLVTMSEAQMLQYVKRALGYLPERKDSVVTNDDDVDLDSILLDRIKVWYAEMLATAPVESLPVANLAPSMKCSINAYQTAYVTFSDNFVRPVAWRLSSWRKYVTHFYEPDEFMATLQDNDYFSAKRARCLAIRMVDKMLLYSAASDTDTLEEALCVYRPTDGTYIIGRRLLDTIADTL